MKVPLPQWQLLVIKYWIMNELGLENYIGKIFIVKRIPVVLGLFLAEDSEIPSGNYMECHILWCQD